MLIVNVVGDSMTDAQDADDPWGDKGWPKLNHFPHFY